MLTFERILEGELRTTGHLALALVLFATPAFAQRDHEQHEPPKGPAVAPRQAPPPAEKNGEPPERGQHAEHGQHGEQDEHAEHAEHRALMMGALGISRSRDGSGTSWLPESSPMYGIMAKAGGWGFMFHGNVFVGYDWFGSDRGSERFISTNSVMAATWHSLGPGEIMFRAMLSAEPATVGSGGYPLILQSGETSDSAPLHDRQHPHDLFMELAAIYTLSVSNDVALQLYLAPAGEPALGPTAFPHRVSAVSDPLAPLGHHWQDATHISFGVITAAVFTKTLKLDASWFNGREPDEERWDLDLRAPDSYSGRLTWNPHTSWSMQTSYGFLESPESLEPDLSIHRVTASVMHNALLHNEGNLATTFVFGENIPDEGPATPALLLESTWSLDQWHDIFGRGEYVQKTGHDLVLPAALEHERFSTGMLSLGYVLHFGPLVSLSPGIGVRGSMGFIENGLEPFYGTQFPLGAMVFAQLRPARMSM